ncbi:MAG: VPA1269 family protein [Hydrogenophaga sp.]|nr:VPA1269 family protein [Hydrogenophaga sp.]
MDENRVAIEPDKASSPPRKRQRPKGFRRAYDRELLWIEHDYPHLHVWRDLARDWLKGETEAVHIRIAALIAFLEKYLVHKGLPLDPAVLLSRQTQLPDFYVVACPDSNAGVSYNNIINSFLNWVLLRDFSEAADDGHPVVSPAFRNPVPRMTRGGLPRLDESVHTPLPYGYIDELRAMLAAGPHFKDWEWARNVSGSGIGKGGSVAPDWFPIEPDNIDEEDPDCVWRLRPLANNQPPVLEVWSPVRWVALLTKLILPLRTMQVRLLDSGEADTWRFAHGGWSLNEGRLASGSEARPAQNGVFRRQTLPQGGAATMAIYVNTNKTADRYLSGPVKGYVLPWPVDGQLHQLAFYWLEKLRDWQEKFNPVTQRTSWTELDGRHIQAKSDVQLAGYPDACFLFRTPESGRASAHLPVTDAMMNRAWFYTLGALEARFVARGETHADGSKVLLLPLFDETNKRSIRTLFPLHSLRVSLITALALDGNVPFPILQKLVGHSRLLMTLYYTKPGATLIHEHLRDAAVKLEANKERSILGFPQFSGRFA